MTEELNIRGENTLERFFSWIDEKGPESGREPLPVLMMVITIVAAILLLTGWREQWEQRTTIGRFALVLCAPVRIALGLIFGAFGVTILATLLLTEIALAVPRSIHQKYREVAFVDEQ